MVSFFSFYFHPKFSLFFFWRLSTHFLFLIYIDFINVILQDSRCYDNLLCFGPGLLLLLIREKKKEKENGEAIERSGRF